MRIKKYNNNEYVVAEDVWVRNPYNKSEPIDINDLSNSELNLFLKNETSNVSVRAIRTDGMDEPTIENAIVCSDGYMWEERQKVLADIPNKKVKIVGVNGSLAKWTMVGDSADKKRVMSFYLVNNPYKECMSYAPRTHRYYPNLVASTKTYPGFFESYQEMPTFYSATRDVNYSGLTREGCMVLDDYRNPVCAAISFLVKRGVKKLALVCCDEAFEEDRPAAVRMNNGLYQYPQQIKSQRIIDRQLYWLRTNGVEVADCSSGQEYENATYINPEDLGTFFGTI
jgi:hypothetical protein